MPAWGVRRRGTIGAGPPAGPAPMSVVTGPLALLPVRLGFVGTGGGGGFGLLSGGPAVAFCEPIPGDVVFEGGPACGTKPVGFRTDPSDARVGRLCSSSSPTVVGRVSSSLRPPSP